MNYAKHKDDAAGITREKNKKIGFVISRHLEHSARRDLKAFLTQLRTRNNFPQCLGWSWGESFIGCNNLVHTRIFQDIDLCDLIHTWDYIFAKVIPILTVLFWTFFSFRLFCFSRLRSTIMVKCFNYFKLLQSNDGQCNLPSLQQAVIRLERYLRRCFLSFAKYL